MRIGIVSDSHDHVWNLRVALRALNGEADLLIHCGDLCSPFIVSLLAKHFDGPIHAVFGNNDADKYRLQLVAAKTGRVVLQGESWLPELDGKRFAVQHFPELAYPLAESGRYDVVCFGHNHRWQIERLESTWLVNPGALLGYDPGAGADIQPSFVVYDTATDRPRTWRIDGEQVVADQP
jgi:putative phosphoesterase